MSQADREELEALMKEFPDWKEQFPDIYRELNPKRYHKSQKSFPHGPQITQMKERGPVPLSDYQETFKYKNVRPRSNKRPPPTPRNPHPPPMQFSTNQRSDFIPQDLNAKPALIVKEDNYVPPDGGFDHNSSYMVDFPGHINLPAIPLQPRGEIKKSVGKFDGQTTTNEFFRPWLNSKPSAKFGEYPCYTGSLLYPDDPHLPLSTTRETFQGEFARRPPACEVGGPNITLKGDMYFDTTNRETYTKYDDAKPASKMNQRIQLTDSKRQKFEGKTQTMNDFPHHQGHQPTKTITPHPTTIDLRFDNKVHFETEQQHEFPVRDVLKHQRPPLVKKEDNMYKPPKTKFQDQSHTQVDFPAHDLTSTYLPPMKVTPKRQKSLPKLDDITSYKVYYPKYDVRPRERHGDKYERGFTPSTHKFTAKTTTQEVFYAKSAEMPRSFKPPERGVDQSGSHDFTTINMVTYKNPSGVNMLPEETAKQLLRALQKRKMQMGAVKTNGASMQVMAV